MRYKEAISNASCPSCGGPTALGEMSFDEHHLRVENARLREEVAESIGISQIVLGVLRQCSAIFEGFPYMSLLCFGAVLQIDRISGIAAKYVGKPMVPYPLVPPPVPSRSPLDLGVSNFGMQQSMGGEIYGAGDLLRSVSGTIPGHSDIDKPMVIELAVAAMEELIRMSQLGEPLWLPGLDGSTEILSEDEYVRSFPRGIGPKPFGLKSEASRETAVVIMNHINLVEILMDAV